MSHFLSALKSKGRFPIKGHQWHIVICIAFSSKIDFSLYGVRNLEKTICFSLKSRPSERFQWPEMSQIKAEISLRTNVKLIFHKNVGWQGYQWIP